MGFQPMQHRQDADATALGRYPPPFGLGVQLSFNIW